LAPIDEEMVEAVQEGRRAAPSHPAPPSSTWSGTTPRDRLHDMARAEQVLTDALALDDAERAEIALRLLDSIEPPDPLGALDDEGWRTEIARRAERAASGASKGTPWAEVRARLEKRLVK
jgi:putative addiction module component (TIGR02574 family)